MIAENNNKMLFLDDLDYLKTPRYLKTIIETTTYFKCHQDVITLAVDNDETGRSLCDSLEEIGLPFRKKLPPLIPNSKKTDWNDY